MVTRLKMWVVAGLVAFAVSSPAYALYPYITPLPNIGDTQCNVSTGSNTFSFVVSWGALIEVKSKRLVIDPRTGKPCSTYKVSVRNYCTVPNGGAVQCGGAAQCSIVVTCPVSTASTSVKVLGTGISSSEKPTKAGSSQPGAIEALPA